MDGDSATSVGLRLFRGGCRSAAGVAMLRDYFVSLNEFVAQSRHFATKFAKFLAVLT